MTRDKLTKKITITVNIEQFERFKQYCNSKLIKVSTKINDLIKKELEQ